MTTFLYLTENKSGDLRVLRMSDEGDLSIVQTVRIGGNLMPLAITPDRRHLFAARRSDPCAILCFAVNHGDGTLSMKAEVPAPDSTVYLSTDRSGRVLLGACNPHQKPATGLVTVYPIGTDGVVGVPQIVRTPPKLHAIIADPDNRFAIAPSCDGDLLVRYRMDAGTAQVSDDGLAPVVVLPGAGPRHLQFHPNGRFLYLVNEYDASVVVYRWAAEEGRLHEIQTSNAAPPWSSAKNKRAADLHFSPDGRWLYVSTRSEPSIMQFEVDSECGFVTPLGSVVTGDEPRSFCIDPSGRWLIAVAMKEDRLISFSIDHATGALERKAEIVTGAGPNWIDCIALD